MNGSEHYREAERLLELAANPKRMALGLDEASLGDVVMNAVYRVPETVEIHDQTLAAAQVHATLALAAATDQNVTRVVTLYPDTEVSR